MMFQTSPLLLLIIKHPIRITSRIRLSKIRQVLLNQQGTSLKFVCSLSNMGFKNPPQYMKANVL